MRLKFIIDEDFLNYKKPSMFIGTAFCTFKCEKECPECHCQNSPLAKDPIIKVDDRKIVERYLKNDITKAIVFGGLEPLDQFDELITLISFVRQECNDDIIIYTGYYENEVELKISQLKQYSNIIVKFGRFIPNSESRYDEVLGIELASKNQYAIKIS